MGFEQRYNLKYNQIHKPLIYMLKKIAYIRNTIQYQHGKYIIMDEQFQQALESMNLDSLFLQ